MIAFTTTVVSRRVLILATFLVASFFVCTVARAEESCGTIIEPRDLADQTGPMITRPIVDCSNPFLVTTDPASPYQLRIDSVVYPNNATVVLPRGETNRIDVVGRSNLTSNLLALYKHEEGNYRFVPMYAGDTTRADFVTHANTYFSTEYDRNFYMEIWDYAFDNGRADVYFYDAEGNDIIDAATGESVVTRYNNFINSLRKSDPMIGEGTYTLLITDILIILNKQNLWQKFAQFLVPVAHAQFEDGWPEYRYTITFTITKETPLPQGASSILFLPGIQASRLYTDGVLGTEDQLWEPNINNDVAQLEMTVDGISVNDVYTKEVVNEIFGILNVYSSFLSLLEDMRDEEEIKDFLAFPYDWRYDVHDLTVSGTRYDTGVKSVINEIERLATSSYSKKVTIVAHSNGGLFAKAIMIELERLGLDHLIDKIVFLGTPQLGTPKAIGVMLHGYGQKQGFGAIIDDYTARDVIRNMPGAYSLLPSEQYFEVVEDSVVTNDSLPETSYLDPYNNIQSYNQLVPFLLDSNSTRDSVVAINVPNKSNENLLLRAKELHQKLDNWIAPTSTQIFEIVGVGLPTIKTFDYRSFPCTIQLGSQCLRGGYSKPYPVTTTYGDETVIATSAAAYKGDKFTGYIDLQTEGENLFIKSRQHSNFTESPTVQEYITSIIKFGYQNETLEIPEDFISITRRYAIIGIHSPVTLLVTNQNNKKIGIENGQQLIDIPGGQYLSLAGSQYIIVPEGEYEVDVSGHATGTYSITIDIVEGEVTRSVGNVIGASSTPYLKGNFAIDNTEISPLLVDTNNDGNIDYRANFENGTVEFIGSTTTAITPTKTVAKPSGTRIKSPLTPQVAGVSYSQAEYYRKVHELLTLLEKYLSIIKNY